MVYYSGPGYGWGWGIFMGIIWLAFVVCAISALIWIIRHHSNGVWTKSDPLDIAKQRYAKGEITREQFEQIKKDLK